MKHVTVYSEENMYAGWPANHGHWQWGNEFLCGFMRGPYEKGGMHNIGEPYQKVQARSLDGGETWSVEVPNVDFSASDYVYNELPKSFNLKDNIIRVCGAYDTGGDDCDPLGGFYSSSDHGKNWEGYFLFKSKDGFNIFEDPNLICTSRTAVLNDFVFLSSRHQDHWGSDSTFCVKLENGKFNVISQVCSDAFRAVMPAVARIENKIFVTLRRRYRGDCWIDCFISEDECKTWKYTSRVSSTGGNNGNPPALISVGNCLFCVYANRSYRTINLSKSFDFGKTWDNYIVRQGNNSDIGYPRLFKRDDNQLVCVYYWAEDRADQQHIEATIFDSTEFI